MAIMITTSGNYFTLKKKSSIGQFYFSTSITLARTNVIIVSLRLTKADPVWKVARFVEEINIIHNFYGSVFKYVQ